MKAKGWIALDIDGTITVDKYRVPESVVQNLSRLQREGWQIALATGRAFCFAQLVLEAFDFPFILLPQNGSVALKMPSKELLLKRYLPFRAIEQVEAAFEGFEADFVVYAGYERGDRCYWRPKRTSAQGLVCLQEGQRREKRTWEAVEEFDSTQLPDFPLIKCCGSPERMRLIGERLKKEGAFQVAQIQDPFDAAYSMLLITDIAASKGASLQSLFPLLGRGEKVIAAGDDENDISLLAIADVKIAMPHAPKALQKMADIIAPPTREEGIISVLNKACAR